MTLASLEQVFRVHIISIQEFNLSIKMLEMHKILLTCLILASVAVLSSLCAVVDGKDDSEIAAEAAPSTNERHLDDGSVQAPSSGDEEEEDEDEDEGVFSDFDDPSTDDLIANDYDEDEEEEQEEEPAAGESEPKSPSRRAECLQSIESLEGCDECCKGIGEIGVLQKRSGSLLCRCWDPNY